MMDGPKIVKFYARDQEIIRLSAFLLSRNVAILEVRDGQPEGGERDILLLLDGTNIPDTQTCGSGLYIAPGDFQKALSAAVWPKGFQTTG
jgi:hypothetical protein